VAPESISKPPTAAFPASKLAPMLRAIADPRSAETVSDRDAEAIGRVDANAADTDGSGSSG
jgi:hypothetical protein